MEERNDLRTGGQRSKTPRQDRALVQAGESTGEYLVGNRKSILNIPPYSST